MKHVVRILSLAVLVALLAAPFVAFAQGDPRCNGLSEADCQIVLQAADMMSGVTSFTIPDFEFYFDLSMPDSDTGELQTVMASGTGNGAVSITSPDDALVYLYIAEASMDDGESSETIEDVEVILTPTMQYVKYEGEWYGGQEETDFSSFDTSALDFNSLMGSLGIDLTNVATTTRGDDAELHGQAMATFSTSIDIGQLLNALLASPAVGEALGMGGEEAMSPEELQMISAFLVPMLEGTSLDAEQWIGLDDGYVHEVSVNLVLSLDMTMFAPEAGALTGELRFNMEMDSFNQPVDVTIPTEYKSLDEMDVEVPDLSGLGAGLGM